jgi:hypothetical protein
MAWHGLIEYRLSHFPFPAGLLSLTRDARAVCCPFVYTYSNLRVNNRCEAGFMGREVWRSSGRICGHLLDGVVCADGDESILPGSRGITMICIGSYSGNDSQSRKASCPELYML